MKPVIECGPEDTSKDDLGAFTSGIRAATEALERLEKRSLITSKQMEAAKRKLSEVNVFTCCTCAESLLDEMFPNASGKSTTISDNPPRKRTR